MNLHFCLIDILFFIFSDKMCLFAQVLVSQEKKDKHAIDTELERLSKTMCSLDEDHQIDETFETDAWLRSVPLSQRLMAAFLPEFETDCKNDNQDSFSQFTTQISSASRCLGDSEGKDKEHLAEIQSEFEITFPNRNGCVALAPNNFRSPVTSNHYSDAKVHSDFIQNGMDRMQNVETDYYNNSPVSRYEQMPLEEKLLLELQSIGFHPETVVSFVLITRMSKFMYLCFLLFFFYINKMLKYNLKVLSSENINSFFNNFVNYYHPLNLQCL